MKRMKIAPRGSARSSRQASDTQCSSRRARRGRTVVAIARTRMAVRDARVPMARLLLSGAAGVLRERLEDDREDLHPEGGDLLHDVLVVPQEQRPLRHLATHAKQTSAGNTPASSPRRCCCRGPAVAVLAALHWLVVWRCCSGALRCAFSSRCAPSLCSCVLLIHQCAAC